MCRTRTASRTFVNAYAAAVSLPASLAFVLETAGAVALTHCGAILDARVAAAAEGGP